MPTMEQLRQAVLILEHAWHRLNGPVVLRADRDAQDIIQWALYDVWEENPSQSLVLTSPVSDYVTRA